MITTPRDAKLQAAAEFGFEAYPGGGQNLVNTSNQFVGGKLTFMLGNKNDMFDAEIEAFGEYTHFNNSGWDSFYNPASSGAAVFGIRLKAGINF